MTYKRLQIGKLGEQLAKELLLAKGYLLLAENWRHPAGEIDLIVREDATIIFVEVRTTSSIRFGTGLESITSRKISKLRRLAVIYMQYYHSHDHAVRFDVVSILLNRHFILKKATHICAAF